MIAVKVYLTRINIEHYNSILLRSPCLKIYQIRDFHHLLPQQLHSLSFNNPDYRQQRMLFSNARNTAGSSEKSPSALSTILSKNNRALDTEIFLPVMHKVKENLIHLLFPWVCEAKRNRQLFTSVRYGDGTQIQRDTCSCVSVHPHSKPGING